MVPREWAVWDLSSDRMKCKLNLIQSFAATGTTFTQQAQDQLWNLKMSLQAWILVSPRQKHSMMILLFLFPGPGTRSGSQSCEIYRTRSGHALVRPVCFYRKCSFVLRQFQFNHQFAFCSSSCFFVLTLKHLCHWGFRDIRALPEVLDNGYSLINRWHLQQLRSSTFLMGLQGFKEIM